MFPPPPLPHQERRTHAAPRSPTWIPVGLQQRAECREFPSRDHRIDGGGGNTGLLGANQVICCGIIIMIIITIIIIIIIITIWPRSRFNFHQYSLEIAFTKKCRTPSEQGGDEFDTDLRLVHLPAVSPLAAGNGHTRLAPMAADSLMSSAKLELTHHSVLLRSCSCIPCLALGGFSGNSSRSSIRFTNNVPTDGKKLIGKRQWRANCSDGSFVGAKVVITLLLFFASPLGSRGAPVNVVVARRLAGGELAASTFGQTMEISQQKDGNSNDRDATFPLSLRPLDWWLTSPPTLLDDAAAQPPRRSIASAFVLLVFVSSGLIQDLLPSLDMTYSSPAALNAARGITNSSQYAHLCV